MFNKQHRMGYGGVEWTAGMRELRRGHVDDYTAKCDPCTLLGFYAASSGNSYRLSGTDRFSRNVGKSAAAIYFKSRTKCVFITHHRKNRVCVASLCTSWTKDRLSFGSWVKDLPVHPSVRTGQSDVHPASYSVRTGI
jgi:hypothetical protein